MGNCHSNTASAPNTLNPTYSVHNKEEVNINFDNLFTETNDPSPLPDDQPTEEKPKEIEQEDIEEIDVPDPEKDMCTICYNKIEKDTDKKLDCGHKYHEACIDTWLKESKTCPICRTPCRSDFETIIINALTSTSIFFDFYNYLGDVDIDLLELLLAHINEAIQDLNDLEQTTYN